MTSVPTWRRVAATAAACAGLALCGCERKNTSGAGTGASAGSSATAAAEAPAVYVVRGEVVSLPEAGKPDSALEVHHEAIDDFVRQDGTRGMNAMTMQFPLAPGASLEGVRIGDIVRLTFEVTMRPRVSWRATKIEKLPAETKLEFRVAKPSDGKK